MAKKKEPEISLSVSVGICEDGCCADYHVSRPDKKPITIGDIAHGFHAILEEFKANGDADDFLKDHMENFQGYDPSPKPKKMPKGSTAH